MSALPALPTDVAAVLSGWPTAAQTQLKTIRRFIFEEARRLDVGRIEETLKWGEPAWLTSESKAGSTIRMAWKPRTPDAFSLYFNCNTDLIDRMQSRYPDEFQFTGKRAASIPLDSDIPEAVLRDCLSMALNYHRDRSKNRL